jgi:uncharacterized protein with HEPN domain
MAINRHTIAKNPEFHAAWRSGGYKRSSMPLRLTDAVIHNLTIIGEAAYHLPYDLIGKMSSSL